ncbi:MAG: hypothetical protein AAGD32_06895 [Planctomycetota bacterium]
MQPIKRIEIVMDSSGAGELESALAAARVTGWSKIPDVEGSGHRGRRTANLPMDVGSNVLFLIAAEPAVADKVVAATRPILETWGGMCLVSDAAWVTHD